MITQKDLKSLLSYDPKTGVFVWLISPSNRHKKGSLAGSKSNNGYISIIINGKSYLAHRLAWFYVYGEWPETIDHINGFTTENKLSNLRNVSLKTNLKNKRKQKNNTSGFSGVHFSKHYKKWVAQISLNGIRKHLGQFKEKEQAIKARKEAEKKYGFHENHGREAHFQ